MRLRGGTASGPRRHRAADSGSYAQHTHGQHTHGQHTHGQHTHEQHTPGQHTPPDSTHGNVSGSAGFYADYGLQ